MRLQIKFIRGGDGSVALIPGEPLTIGRSRSNKVRLIEPDVSARHVSLVPDQNDLVIMEVVSARQTALNGNPLKLGDTVSLSSGDRVILGDNTEFVYEALQELKIGDNKTVIPGSEATIADPLNASAFSASEVTVVGSKAAETCVSSGATNFQNDVNETIAIQTQIASDDEVEELRRSYQNKHKKKIIFRILPLAFLLALTIAIWIAMKPEKEEFVSWPIVQGSRAPVETQLVAPYLAVLYPKLPDNSVKRTDESVDIRTKFGKLKDVPLRIVTRTWKEKDSLVTDREVAFTRFLNKEREKDVTFNTSGSRVTKFISTNVGAGVPLTSIAYLRRVGNDDAFGQAIFLRFEDVSHLIMIEVPRAMQWRAEDFIRHNAMEFVLFADRRVSEYWEGFSKCRVDTEASKDIEEASQYLKRKAPIYWQQISWLLRSALVKAKSANDQSTINEAKVLLSELRKSQREKYNSWRLSWKKADVIGDKSEKQKIQDLAESAFQQEFQHTDYRYDLIKRKDWE